VSVSLITLEEAKAQARVRHNDEDFDIERTMRLATAQVLGYLEAEANVAGSPAEWSVAEETVPDDVKAGILALFAELWRYRGDDKDPPPRGPNGVFSAQVEGYLKMRRPPALA
jgi:hypothetical protein